MEFDKISVRVVLIMLLFGNLFNSAKAQNQSGAAKEIVANLYDIHDDTAKSYLAGDAIFILVTNKSCVKCFDDACQYLDAHYEKHFKVYGLIMMPRNYLELIPTAEIYKDEISCARDFYFYFTSASENAEIRKIEEMPSPQMIIKTGNNYQYIPYGDVIKLK